VVNPAWRKLDSQVRSLGGRLYRLAARFGALVLSEDPAESQIQGFQQRKGQWREEIQALELEIDNLKQRRKETTHHIPVQSLPEKDQFPRLRTERKHFIDTLKMIAYRAESSMASLLGEHMARGGDDARALRRPVGAIARNRPGRQRTSTPHINVSGSTSITSAVGPHLCSMA